MKNLTFTLSTCLIALSTLSQSAFAETYTGKLSNSNAFIAIVTSGDQMVAYTCDSSSLALWFRSSLSDTSYKTISEDQNARFTARVTQNTSNSSSGYSAGYSAGNKPSTQITGSIRLEDGSFHSFKATLTTKNTNSKTATAGLFRSENWLEGTNYTGGWVVLDNGEQRGSMMGGGTIRPTGAIPLTGELKTSSAGVGEVKPFVVDEAWVSSNGK
jgi:hypothetical protein